MHMHEWTSELITQRPAISQGDPLAGWATEDKWVLQGQLSDSLEGTKCPLQRQGDHMNVRDIHGDYAVLELTCVSCI